MTRAEFADLVERYASQELSGAEWDRFFVTHYRDEKVENARRAVIEIAHETRGELSPERLREVRAIAFTLREAT